MLAAGLKHAADGANQRAAEHVVVKGGPCPAGGVFGAEVGGCQAVDVARFNGGLNVLEVFADGIVGMLARDLDEAVEGQILRDLEALVGQLEVEALGVLIGLAVDLDLLGVGVPAKAAATGLCAKHGEHLGGLELLWLAEGGCVGLSRLLSG